MLLKKYWDDSLIVKLIDSCDDLWGNALNSCVHDVYHTAEWIAASRHCDDGVAMAVYVCLGDQVALYPFLKRDIKNDMWDVTSAYGYGGPIFHQDATLEWMEASLASAICMLKEAGCVSWFIRLHPLLNSSWSSSVGLVENHGQTISVDLRKSAEQHWRETRSGHKGDIRKSIKAGIEIEFNKSPEALNAFINIYRATMSALDATDYYYFKDEYFQDLLDGLGDSLLLIMAKENDVYIGASMFTLNKSSLIMQYHLSGTLPNYRHRQPSKLILHSAIKWGRDNSCSWLHLGGGVGSQEDALFGFKKGFSQNSSVFQTHRIVVNNEKYIELCDSNNSVLGDLSGFFPLYRKSN